MADLSAFVNGSPEPVIESFADPDTGALIGAITKSGSLIGITAPRLTGLDGAQPPAAPLPAGTEYFATDTEVTYYSDGAAWQFAISQAEGISAPAPAVFPGLTYLLAPGSAVSSVTASGGLTAVQDTVNYDWGSQSIKCTTDGAGGSGFLTLTPGSPVDLSNACLVIGLEIDSFTPYSDFQIRLSSDGFTSSNFDFCKPAYTGASQRWVEAGLWELITISRGGPAGNMSPGQWAQNGTGLASYASVSSIRIKAVDNGGGNPVTFRIGFIGYFTRPAQGLVSITFDDSRLTQYTVAKPVMDQYGIRGTIYNIGYNVQNAASLGSAYFNDAQLKQFQADSHWEMGAHAFTDATGVQAHTVGYDSLTSHDGEIDLLQLKTWLRQQQALGIDSFALPHGTWSLNASGTARANPDVLSLMAKYFNTCATTLANTIETYPPANRLKLRRYVATSTDTAASLMAMVNAAITNKWWLILAFHNIVTTPASGTDFATAQFQSFIQQVAQSGVATPTVGEVWRNPPQAPWAAGSGSGGVSSVSAGDASVSVTNGSSAPVLETGTLDQIAGLHPPAASVAMNSQKITGLAAGVTAGEAAHWGQLASLSPAEVSLLAWAGDQQWMNATAPVLTTGGTVYISLFVNRKVQTFTNLLCYVGTAGSVLTSGQCFAGIYDSTGTLRATTADQASAWASTGLKTAAFASPYVSAPVGTYYFAFMFNGTTGPAFKGSGAPSSLYNAGLSGAALRCATTSSTGNTTALPSSITLSGNASVNSVPAWGAIT